MTTELTTNYDSRKSFYGKARVEANYPTVRLWSYETCVAELVYHGQPDSRPMAKVYGTYSATTLRHIKEFLRQHGFKADNAKQIMADYGAVR